MVQPLRKTVWRFIRKLKIELPNNPAIPGHIPRQNYDSNRYMHPYVHSSTTHNSDGKAWKQPKCPSTDEWIKMMWYTTTDPTCHSC